jgi:hypothetical protein
MFYFDVEKHQEAPTSIPELVDLLSFLKEIKENITATETKVTLLQ